MNETILSGFKNYKLWWQLALSDLTVTYRRSLLGLFWIIISFVMFISVKIFIFGKILNIDPRMYTIWVTSGYALWLYVQNMVTDGCNVFVSAKPWILGTRLSYGTFVAQSIAKHAINFGLVSLAVIAILIFYQWPMNWTILTTFAGLLFLILTSIWVHIFLGTLCAQNRDLMYLIQSIMHVMFFLTPILYMPDQLGRRGNIINYNPFTHYLAIVRDPIVFGKIPYNSWMIVGAITGIGIILTIFVMRTRTKKIAFWV